MRTVLNSMHSIERLAAMMMSSSCIPAERKNQGDCLAACLLALEKGISPFIAIHQLPAAPAPDTSTTGAVDVADALLKANDSDSMQAAESLLDTIHADDETTAVLIKIHQFKLATLAVATS